MATARERPYLNGNFVVDLGSGEGDSVPAGFAEVFLPDARIEALEYRNGNEKTSEPRKLPGRVGYDNLVLRRGVIGHLDLYEWWDQARNGDAGVRRTVTVALQAEDHSQVLRWTFTNAWPTRYAFSPLDADSREVVVEELELAFERMVIE
jgi:phage tail-like protein